MDHEPTKKPLLNLSSNANLRFDPFPVHAVFGGWKISL
jgi:hypothetical protein